MKNFLSNHGGTEVDCVCLLMEVSNLKTLAALVRYNCVIQHGTKGFCTGVVRSHYYVKVAKTDHLKKRKMAHTLYGNHIDID